MPSGSNVIVRPYTNLKYNRNGTYLHVYVNPLTTDAHQTTGLCGNYNLNATDDGPPLTIGCTLTKCLCTKHCERHRQEL